MSSSLMRREIVCLILQFLREHNYNDTIHTLEKESGVFFNMTYFKDIAANGELDEVVKYLPGFTKSDDNEYSRLMFFEIRKQKYLEALDRGDIAKAVEILKELKRFSEFDDTTVKDLTYLLTLENFSLTKQYSRQVMLEKLNNWVLKNPVFHDKLQFPNLDDSRLTTVINQSLNWQHYMCISPKPYPDIKTLFMDHSCEPPNVNCDPSAVTKNIGFFTKEPVIFTSASSSNTRINVGIADGRVQLFPDARQNGDTQFLPCVKSRVIDESQKYKIWRPIVINQSSGLRALRLQDSLSPEKVVKLMYTHAGSAIIALANNAMHKVWKWQKNEKNLSGKATSAVPPQLWLPSNGIKMSNDIEKINKENALPCFTLTKDDAHLLSASGGMVSLFMMQSFKVEYTCCPPPPAATCLAFHPKDNNIIAIGMDDSSILVYDIKFAKVKNKLTDHQHKVTGLAFSVVLNVLVSSGADAQGINMRKTKKTDPGRSDASNAQDAPTAPEASNPIVATSSAPCLDVATLEHMIQETVNRALRRTPPESTSTPVTTVMTNPPEFSGTNDLVVVEQWIKLVEKATAVFPMIDQEKIWYATYLLRGDAMTWWELMEQTQDTTSLTWSGFKELFEK
ncbi:topless-related protein 4-like [Pistacia vera]|uniref:topless-related protein 4-like n=1 Tax=Pistacia vera TaxID=55513 RepID=UPI001263A320|nr:topless-related protein 4-like [Pistacia vera]